MAQRMNTQQTTREAVGVFNTLEDLDAAVAELEVTAFPRHDISVLGTQEDIKEKFGHRAVRAEWLEDNPEAPRMISVRPEEKAIGAGVVIGVCAYIAGCIAAVAGRELSGFMLVGAITASSFTGAVVGILLALVISHILQRRREMQLKKGGLLLWVRTPGPKREEIAQNIMSKHGARHVHLHDIT